MKGSPETNCDPIHNSSRNKLNSNNSPPENQGSVSPEAEPSIRYRKIWSPASSIFGSLSSGNKKSGFRIKSTSGRSYYEVWRAAVSKAMMNGDSVRRILGFSRTSISASRSDIWLLGVCYQVSQEGDDSSNPTQSEGFAAFVEDFSSRILITYRKGTQSTLAFLIHKLGRLWRKSPHKQLDPHYVEILSLFGDSEDSPCSIHNLLQAGKAYGLAPGSWVGPYAMCRTFEILLQNTRGEADSGVLSSMMTLFVVSGDEDGERGGAPVICVEDIARHCSEFGGGQVDWAPILLMIPLVLGLEKVNPRYIPLLSATFTFPQSLGILGGRPGASTYLVGVQDENAFYLDPHEVQQVVDIKRDNVDYDTTSYHCNVVRHVPLDSIDSSLAIGFYCRDKSDFEDFCVRASQLIDQSNGAPLFTIAKARSSPKPPGNHSAFRGSPSESEDYDHRGPTAEPDDCEQEDDWQLL
ncbi:hypothetical protein CASFOL_018316 [Castilleja foliolosa]|uniref:Cysteine protease n=1 Tax=Castilleja foliolosa TaxID=1961234 RepID=A0ABD3D6K0_9LAMI